MWKTTSCPDKCVQSIGAAIAWHVDAQKAPSVDCFIKHVVTTEHIMNTRYINIFISNWVLLASGLIFAIPLIYLHVKDANETVPEGREVSG
jgi:hypothetical protein